MPETNDAASALLRFVDALEAGETVSVRLALATLTTHPRKQAAHTVDVDATIGDPGLVPANACLLESLLNADVSSPLGRTKALCRAKLLGQRLAPNTSRFSPAISILVDEGSGEEDEIRRALDSALAQEHVVEILVPASLHVDRSRFRDCPLRVVSPKSGGRAAFLSQAVDDARGDFLLFLSPGDILTQSAASIAADAFANMGDLKAVVPTDDAPTPRDPFLFALAEGRRLSGAMLPAWLVREAAPFDDRPRDERDGRFWLKLARMGLKGVALPTLACRRPHSTPLTRERAEAALDAHLASARDLLAEPRRTRYVLNLLARATAMVDWASEAGLPDAVVATMHQRVVAVETEATGLASPAGAGVSAILAQRLAIQLECWPRPLRDPLPRTTGLRRERIERLQDRIEQSGPISGADLRRWLPELPSRPFGDLAVGERATLAEALDHLRECATDGRLEIPARLLLRVGADFPGHPWEKSWRRWARLAQVVGEAAARRIMGRRQFANPAVRAA